jgi:hypothetical protein
MRMSKKQALGMVLCLVTLVALAAQEMKLLSARCGTCGKCCDRVLLGEMPRGSIEYADQLSNWLAQGEGGLRGCTHARHR